MREIQLKRRNPFIAAWLSYRQLRRLKVFSRRTCLRLAIGHFYVR